MAKNFCFTLNNYTEDEYVLILNSKEFSYIIIGKEVCPNTGTQHLQGYFQLTTRRRLDWIKKHINNRMHIEKAKGDFASNFAYCSKENNYIARGIPKIAGSNKNQLFEEIQACDTWLDVLQIDGINRHMTYAREVFNHKPIAKQEDIQPRKWQKLILDILAVPPDDRKIIWVYDENGAAGKTYLSKYLVSNYGAFYFAPAKSADILYAYNNETIIIYDIPRSLDEEYINYGVIEKLKDGIYFTGKYQSAKKVRGPNAHIIVFANRKPEEGKFSKDRIQLIEL